MKTYLYNKDFRWITISDWVSVFGDAIFYLVILSFATGVNKSELAISLVAFCDLIPDTLSFLMGYCGDHTRNKFRADCLSAVIRAVLFIIIAFTFWTLKGWSVLSISLAIKLVSDLLGVYSDNLRFSEIYAVVPRTEYENSAGFSLAVCEVVSIVGRIVGGVVLILLQYQYGLFSIINSLTFIICALCMLRVFRSVENKISKFEKENKRETVHKKYILNVFLRIKDDKEGLKVLVYMMLLNGVISSLLPIIYIFLSKKNWDTEQYTLVISVINTICVIGAVFGSFISGGLLKNISLIQSLFLGGLAVVCLVIMQKCGFIIPVLFFIFAIFLFQSTIAIKFTAYQMQKQEFENLGASVGIYNTVLTISSPIFLIIITCIGNISNYQISFDAILLIMSVFLLWLFFNRDGNSRKVL